MLEKINNYIYYCLVFLVAMLPFHAFLKTWFSSLLTETNVDFLSSGSFLIGAWKEVLLVFLFFILCLKLIIEFIQKKKLPFRLRSFDYALLAFAACLLLSPLWTNFEGVAYVWAVKTNLSFIVAYFIVRVLNLNEKQEDTLLKVMLGSATIVIVFGLILYFFLPHDFLQNFGYTPYISSYVDSKPLPFLHGMGSDLKIARLASTLSGPNQFATYLIIILALVIATVFHKYKLGEKKFKRFEILLGGIACLVLTFSRAAWLGFGIAFLIVFLGRIKWRKYLKYLLAFLLSLLLLGVSLLYSHPDLKENYLLRIDSSSEHWEQTVDGLKILRENPLGLGMGQAGPVSRRLKGEEKGIISENWYLQIAQEAGIPALVLWLLALFLLLNESWDQNTYLETASLFLLLAISIDALFLHAWTDSVTALLAFIVLGMQVSSSNRPA